MRTGLALVLIAALSFGTPISSAETPSRQLSWQDLGEVAGPVVGDGEQVAWQVTPTSVVVRDDTGTDATVADPAGCALGLRAVERRYLLFACDPAPRNPPGAATAYVVENRVTGSMRRIEIGDRFTFAGGEVADFVAIGSNWIAALYAGNHVSTYLFVDWRTWPTTPSARLGDRDNEYVDLDAGRLRRPLCRPLLRRRSSPSQPGEDTTPSFGRLVRSGDWFLDGVGWPQLAGYDHPLRVRHCGTRRSLDLGTGNHAEIGAGWVTWRSFAQDGRLLQALRLHDGRTFTAALPAPQSDLALALSHTSRALYLTLAIGPDYAPTGYRLLRANLPRPSTRSSG